ncbi:MAG: RCC1 domain-containing protein, partial [Bdellovibrionales bacterium]
MGEKTLITKTLKTHLKKIIFIFFITACPLLFLNCSGGSGGGSGTSPESGLNLPKSAKKVSGGNDFTCGLDTSGSVYCWGFNEKGQLGDGSTNFSTKPKKINLSGIVDIFSGESHTCAIGANGSLWCWGDNRDGQIGNNDSNGSAVLNPFQAINSGVISGTAGKGHTCVVMDSGALKCWGDGNEGQLGLGDGESYLTPQTIVSSGIVGVAAGTWHTCYLKITGKVDCFGNNSFYQLGLGNTTTQYSPVEVINSGANYIAAGSQKTCVIMSSNELRCWGLNTEGSVGNGGGNGGYVQTPTFIQNNVKSVIIDSAHACSLDLNNIVRCWGQNAFGALGNSSTTSSDIPVIASSVSNAKNLFLAGSGTSCAVSALDQLFCWGSNSNWQLVLPMIDYQVTPFKIPNLLAKKIAIAPWN